MPDDLSFPAADGLPLRAWHWPQAEPAGVLVISHGLGEHSACYAHVAEALGPRLGVDVVAFDYRGHGRSPGARGVVSTYEDLVGDLRGALAWAERRYPGRPRFVLAHSNGGQVALRALLDGQVIDGLILSNPSLRLAMRVPAHKRLVGEFLRRFAPRMTLQTELIPEAMTRDPEMIALRRDDALRHGRISAPLYFGMIEGGPRIAARVGEIRAPLLVLLGLSDPVVDAAFTRSLFDRIGGPDKTLRTYPDVLHEILNDLERHQVFDEIADWLAPRLGREPIKA